MSDPEKEPKQAGEASVKKETAPDLPDDLKLSPEPEGDIEKLVERGRQMGF
ncbi:hypothetical protein BH09VER1_BH09VER1_20210 [soil metagenome]